MIAFGPRVQNDGIEVIDEVGLRVDAPVGETEAVAEIVEDAVSEDVAEAVGVSD